MWNSLAHSTGRLKRYSYKRRTEIKTKDKSFARLDLVRYVDGKMETIPLETPTRPDQSARPRGLRGKIAEKKIEQKKDEMKQEREQLDAQ